MRAQDAMTCQVVSVVEDTTLADAIHLMLARQISGLPVVDREQRPVGFLTQGDLLRRIELGMHPRRPSWMEFFRGPGRQAQDYVRTHTHRVGDIMTRDLVAVAEDTLLDEVVALMEEREIKRVLVVRHGTLVGLISHADLLRALQAHLEDAAAPCSDQEIRKRLLGLLEAESWAPRTGFRVSCMAGVVTLEGMLFDERERAALRVAAQSIAGVKRVDDQMTWVDPVSGLTLGPDPAT